MATTLTREQRTAFIELYENDGNNEWDVADVFKQMRPKTFRRALRRVCKMHNISEADYENPDSSKWLEVDTEGFRVDLKNVIFDKCGIDYGNGGYQLKEDIENA